VTADERRALIERPLPAILFGVGLPDSVRTRLTEPVYVHPTSYKWSGTIIGDTFYSKNGPLNGEQGDGRD
jgi:hypothetical protein